MVNATVNQPIYAVDVALKGVIMRVPQVRKWDATPLFVSWSAELKHKAPARMSQDLAANRLKPIPPDSCQDGISTFNSL
ncbi:MAG: hypothetical protein JKY54_03350 [Flavobacteriales bacterium]|nr:hypothetical protein [Flavobacteriales bacterium]